MRKPPFILLLVVALTAGATPKAAPEEAKKPSLRESLNPLFEAYLGDGKLDKTETYAIGVAWFSPGLWRSVLDMLKRGNSKDNGVNSKDNGVNSKDNGVNSKDNGVNSKDNGVNSKDNEADSRGEEAGDKPDIIIDGKDKEADDEGKEADSRGEEAGDKPDIIIDGKDKEADNEDKEADSEGKEAKPKRRKVKPRRKGADGEGKEDEDKEYSTMYGAIARNDYGNAYALTVGYSSQAEADNRAIFLCRQKAGGLCNVSAIIKDPCAAIAKVEDGQKLPVVGVSPGWGYGISSGDSKGAAVSGAMAKCEAQGGNCRVDKLTCRLHDWVCGKPGAPADTAGKSPSPSGKLKKTAPRNFSTG